MSSEQNTNHSLTNVLALAISRSLKKKRKGIFPMTHTNNPHAWSLLLATAFVLAIISPVGQMAAQVAGY
jgi:uncharacterized membrane protein